MVTLKKLELWKKIIIALIAGIVVGCVLSEQHALLFKPIGDLFVNAIKMLVVPLVFCSLVTGIGSVSSGKKMGRIGAKAFSLYLISSLIAVLIGLALATVLHPGSELSQQLTEAAPAVNAPNSFMETLLNIIPTNPLAALSSDNMLQIIFFALVLGIAINLAGQEGKPLLGVIESGAKVMYKLTAMVMAFAPIGVFALMIYVAGSLGLSSLLPLLKVIVLIYIGYIILIIGVYALVIKYLLQLSPRQFFRHILNAMSMAFTTSSSLAALPLSMDCATRKLGISKHTASFVLPLGATINMDGTALYLGIATLFIAQISGVSLHFSDYMLIVGMTIVTSIGAAGIPGAVVVMLSSVLVVLGLPLEGIVLLIAVDRIIDMGRSTINIISDLFIALVVASSENELDKAVFNCDKDEEPMGTSITTPPAGHPGLEPQEQAVCER